MKQAWIATVILMACGSTAFAETSISDLEARIANLEKVNLQLRDQLQQIKGGQLPKPLSKQAVGRTSKQSRPQDEHVVQGLKSEAQLAQKYPERTLARLQMRKADARQSDIAVSNPISTGLTPSAVWDGFYVGLIAGGQQSSLNPKFNYDYSNSYHDIAPNFVPNELAGVPIAPSHSSSLGALGGVNFGYNKIVSSKFLLGVEADVVALSGKNKGQVGASGVTTWHWSFGGNNTVTSATELGGLYQGSVNWLSTVRARWGLINGNLLSYVTAGGAFAHTEVSTSQNARNVEYGCGSVVSVCNAQNGMGPFIANWRYMGVQKGYASGITGGAGLEYALPSNLLIRVEYLFYQLKNKTNVMSISDNTTTGVMSASFFGNMVRGGVLYKF